MEISLLRIESADSAPNRTTLRLAGRLGAAEVDTLLGAADACLAQGRVLELDLADLRFTDEQGASALCSLRNRGALLHRPSGFTAELLRVLEEER